jgi:hypothetical protein
MKHKVLSWIALGCLAAALFLMALPTSTTMVFAAGPNTRSYEHYSYFSTMHIGYADWSPILTAAFAIAASGCLLVTLLFRRANPSWFRAARITASLAGGFSLLMLFLHTQMGCFNVYGLLVALLLPIAAVLLWIGRPPRSVSR